MRDGWKKIGGESQLLSHIHPEQANTSISVLDTASFGLISQASNDIFLDGVIDLLKQIDSQFCMHFVAISLLWKGFKTNKTENMKKN